MKKNPVGRPVLSARPTQRYIFRHEIGYMNGLLKRSGEKEISTLIRKALDFYSKKGIKDDKGQA